MGALTRVKEVGLGVPDDVSIIGFDDIPSAERAETPLTTIRQPTTVIGVKAVDMVLKRIENRHLDAVQLTVPAELILRATTGHVAARRSTRKAA